MTLEEYVQEASERMRADGSSVSVVSLTGGPAVVGYQSRFRLRWMATKLHLFTVVVSVPQATIDVVSSVTAQGIDYAKKTKGKFRGFQSGVAVIPVVVAAEVLADARAAVETRPAKSFAVITLPAIVDIKKAARRIATPAAWCWARSIRRGCVSAFGSRFRRRRNARRP